MQALIPQALAENQIGGQPSASFPILQKEIDDYLESTTGSAFDAPLWLQSLEEVVDRTDEQTKISVVDRETVLKQVRLRRRQLLHQLARWDKPSSKK